MNSTDVVIVSLHNRAIWQIKRYAPGRPFLGWARADGTFTEGISPTPESFECITFRTAADAVTFAQGQSWNIVSVMER
jgi:hypothetical protein